LRRGLDEGVITEQYFRVQFLGTPGLGADLEAVTRELGIERLVEFLPRVPRKQSIQAMMSASALLLLQPGHTVSVPGKLYEYLAAGRPILAIAEEGETAAVVRESGIGVSVTPENPAGVLDALREVMARAVVPVPPPPRALYDGSIGAGTIVDILRTALRRGSLPAAVGVGIQP
jgi:glycosyltransferase involved in cell wall biosynthesis